MKHFNVGNHEHAAPLKADSGMAGFLARVRKGSLRGSLSFRGAAKRRPVPLSFALALDLSVRCDPWDPCHAYGTKLPFAGQTRSCVCVIIVNGIRRLECILFSDSK